jgi:hypothetical protein
MSAASSGFRLTFKPVGDGPPACIRIRKLLKAALRACGLRCVKAEEMAANALGVASDASGTVEAAGEAPSGRGVPQGADPVVVVVASAAAAGQSPTRGFAALAGGRLPSEPNDPLPPGRNRRTGNAPRHRQARAACSGKGRAGIDSAPSRAGAGSDAAGRVIAGRDRIGWLKTREIWLVTQQGLRVQPFRRQAEKDGPASEKSDLLRLPFAAGYGSVTLFPAAPLASS